VYVSSRALSRIAVSVGAIGLVVTADHHVHAQRALATAEQFVRTAYDELVRESLGVRVTLQPLGASSPPDWSNLPEIFVQLERGTTKAIQVPEDLHTQLLAVSVSIDISGRVMRARSNGTYVRSRDLEDMQRFAVRNSDWSDEKLLTELKRRGAQYVDDAAEFEKAARLGRFETVLGRIIDRRITFQGRYPRTEMPDSFAFEWVADLRMEPRPNEQVCYTLVFEPFNARLIGLAQDSSCGKARDPSPRHQNVYSRQ
jgi:hypothetical protein